MHRRAISRMVDGNALIIKFSEKAFHVVVPAIGNNFVVINQLRFIHFINASHKLAFIGFHHFSVLEAGLHGKIELRKQKSLEIDVDFLLTILDDVTLDVLQHGCRMSAKHNMRCMPHLP